MSCAWASIDLDNITKTGNLELPLFGGAPNITSQILNTDVRTGRTTLMGKIGKFFNSNIKSQLSVKVQTRENIRPA